MIEELSAKLKSLALLDAIIEQEWEYRYFSYDSNWSESEEMASLRDGCGGQWFFWISGDLAGYKCLSFDDGLMPDLESVKSSIPEVYSDFIAEPAFSMSEATCIWYLENSQWVKHGKSVNGLISLGAVANWEATDYQVWAIEYYERGIDLDSIEKVFSGQFSEELAKSLNPEIKMPQLLADFQEIGIIKRNMNGEIFANLR